VVNVSGIITAAALCILAIIFSVYALTGMDLFDSLMKNLLKLRRRIIRVSKKLSIVEVLPSVLVSIVAPVVFLKEEPKVAEVIKALVLYVMAFICLVYPFTGKDFFVWIIKCIISILLKLGRVKVAVLFCVIIAIVGPLYFVIMNVTPKKYALVIGNYNYTPDFNLPLLSTPDDNAVAVTNALTKLGWNVKRCYNATHSQLGIKDKESLIMEFRDKYKGIAPDYALFFFSGYVKGTRDDTYLISSDNQKISVFKIRERL